MTLKNYISKPFETIQEKTLLILGACTLIIASLVAYMTSTRFDGVIDVHIVTEVKWYQPLTDNIVNTVTLALFLFLLSLLQPTKTRIVDLLNVALISRTPLYLSLLANIGGYNQQTSEYLLANLSNPFVIKELPTINLVVLVLGGVIALIALVLMGLLLYRGYKTATNAKKASHTVMLILVVILAETLSKFIVYQY